MSEERTDQSFQVTQPARLDVSNIRGSIDIQVGTDDVISLTAIKYLDTGNAADTKVVIDQETDGTVKARTKYPDRHMDWLFASRPCKVDYIIKAPRQCTLRVRGVSNSTLMEGFTGDTSVDSVSGDITLRNLDGSIRVNTVSGDARLVRLTGDLRLNTVSGNISGEHLSGSMHLDTVSGDVRFDDSTLTSVNATSVSGDVRAQTSLAEGSYHFGSVSGGVRLKVPAETRCTAELHSISGSISSNLPQTHFSRQNGTQVVEVQGGGVKVHLNSISGELQLEQ